MTAWYIVCLVLTFGGSFATFAGLWRLIVSTDILDRLRRRPVMIEVPTAHLTLNARLEASAYVVAQPPPPGTSAAKSVAKLWGDFVRVQENLHREISALRGDLRAADAAQEHSSREAVDEVRRTMEKREEDRKREARQGAWVAGAGATLAALGGIIGALLDVLASAATLAT